MTSFLVITDENSIDFAHLLQDYRENFVGRRVKISTNYNLLSEFEVVFTETDFPHLMGWNTLLRKNVNASEIIRQVDAGTFTKKKAKKNLEWYKSRSRMLNYNFLTRIFYDQDIQTFVSTRDMQPNRLKLDVVFILNKTNESVIFGLRKCSGRDFFIPTTLHTEKLDNEYNHRRMTKIRKIEWMKTQE